MINIHNDVMMYFNHSLLTPTRILCKFLGFAIVTMILFVALTPALTASATLTTHTTHIVFVIFCAIASSTSASHLEGATDQQCNHPSRPTRCCLLNMLCRCKSACNGLLLLQSHCCCWFTANWPDQGSAHKKTIIFLLDNRGEPVASSQSKDTFPPGSTNTLLENSS